MVIGLTGKNASGKGEVAKYLERKSFYYASLSDIIREELEKEGKPITRPNLIERGNLLRKHNGESYLAERVCDRLDGNKNYVIDSIRNPGEIEYLKRRGDFILVYVDAPPELRFKRIAARGRSDDPSSFEDFLRYEDREELNKDSYNQQLKNCKELAEYVLKNEGSLKELYKSIDDLTGRVMKKFDRPSWDEYFMNIAKVVASRSNCIKRKVASIIVKDKRIISTGYNGTPRGTKNCNEGGCPRCMGMAESGKDLGECLCSHGEENAITQAAYHGISVKDSTLYTTFSPCLICTKMIINAGIREVVYNEEYTMSEVSLNLLKEAKVSVRRLKI